MTDSVAKVKPGKEYFPEKTGKKECGATFACIRIYFRSQLNSRKNSCLPAASFVYHADRRREIF